MNVLPPIREDEAERLAPSWPEPGRLWSLWDMLEFKVKPFLDIQDQMAQWAYLISNDPRNKDTVMESMRTSMVECLLPFGEYLNSYGFDMCSVAAERLIGTLNSSNDSRQILGHLQDLRQRVLDQVGAVACFSLSVHERELYEGKVPPFGNEVETAFPSANDDIYEAGKCLALGRSTACVMHLMRVVEGGLAALAATLDVPKQNDWGSYLRKIEEELASRVKIGGARSPDEQFYSEVALTIQHMRRAWRNPSMHMDRSYSVERASEIRNSVKSFMAHLATKVSERPSPTDSQFA